MMSKIVAWPFAYMLIAIIMCASTASTNAAELAECQKVVTCGNDAKLDGALWLGLRRICAGKPPPPPPPKKIFDGECVGPELLKFYHAITSNANPGTNTAERVQNCANACFGVNVPGSGVAKGFVVTPDTGVCWCESQDSSTCTRIPNLIPNGQSKKKQNQNY